jgi:hypothetical protein
MIKSKKYWDELFEKSKNENLEPLEVVPIEEQEQEGKILDEESRWMLAKQKILNGGK